MSIFRVGPIAVSLCCLLIAVSDVHAATMADPTRPYPEFKKQGGVSASSKVQKSAMTLESVIVGQKRKIAFINGKRLREGQSINGSKILKIHSNEVVVLHQGKTITLPLSSEKKNWITRTK